MWTSASGDTWPRAGESGAGSSLCYSVLSYRITKMKRQLLSVALTLAIYPAMQTAEAQRYDDSETDRLSLKLGSYSGRDFNTRVRVDSSSGLLGTVLDFEETLQVENSVNVARLDGYYRFKPNHRVDFAYFKFDRTGIVTLQQDVRFEDETFSAGSRVDSLIDSEVYKLGYSYSFIHVSQFEFGVGAGLHITNKKISLEAPDFAQEEVVDATSPLPVVGFRGEFAFTPKLSISGSAEYFLLTTDEYKGSFTDFLLALEHQTFANVGFGLAFNRINFDLEADYSDLRGEVKIAYNGWLLYVDVGF